MASTSAPMRETRIPCRKIRNDQNRKLSAPNQRIASTGSAGG